MRRMQERLAGRVFMNLKVTVGLCGTFRERRKWGKLKERRGRKEGSRR